MPRFSFFFFSICLSFSYITWPSASIFLAILNVPIVWDWPEDIFQIHRKHSGLETWHWASYAFFGIGSKFLFRIPRLMSLQYWSNQIPVLLSIILLLLLWYAPGEVLNFHFGMRLSVQPKGPKLGAKRMGCCQIWGLKELIFCTIWGSWNWSLIKIQA